MGVLYILDEPSIGLHQRDNEKLLGTLKRLRDLGNTVIVVEHDEETMYAADCIVDVGPGAGIHGGEIVCTGDVDKIKACGNSVTGQYLSGKRAVPVPEERRKGNGKFLEIRGAAENNLKNINVKIPLGELVCVTGVSGSGKSSLINEILYKTLARELNRAKMISGKHKELRGVENLDKVIEIDQSPIGRTPRSNAATYTGLFTDIRALFATTQDAKMRGFDQSRFSFNVKGGRCEACQGDGIIKIEMHFLSDVYVPCEVCKGKRYNRETLEVKYKGKSISDVRGSDGVFREPPEALPQTKDALRRRFGLYQARSARNYAFGRRGTARQARNGAVEAQHWQDDIYSRRADDWTILDEPTTGLHIADVHRLVDVLQMLVEGGNTVVVIEHNLDLIKTADHIIDLGPEGGDMGGQIIAQGTPEQVAQNPDSFTGQYLKPLLQEKNIL